jgi:hypothetical protein
MKLPARKVEFALSDQPRQRLFTLVQAQFHRLTLATDEVKAQGTLTALDNTLKILQATTDLIDQQPRTQND